ncbi:MAG: DUF2797 domain-containing protein [Myxococcota bacterium]
MPDRVLVVGWTWQDDTVQLRTWSLADRRYTSRTMSGSVAFRVEPGRHCTGFHDGRAMRPCPNESEAVRGRQCQTCQLQDAFRPCMTCNGFRCPRLSQKMRSYCHGTHHLYLACFGAPTLKVGTASHHRRNQRVIEQGPLAAVRIAEADGPTIKRMEHLLVEAGFTETMRRQRKTVLLQAAMTEAEAREHVGRAVSELHDQLPREYHGFLHDPIWVEQPAVAKESRRLAIQELRVADDRVVEGNVVGAVGHLLFVDDGDGCWALDLGELRGRRIEWDPEGPRKRAQAQLGLF